MDSSISDALQAALDAYKDHFEMMSSLGAALFGAAIFIVSRTMGMITDDNFFRPKASWLILISASCGLGVILLGYISNNTLANFHVDILRDGPTICAFPTDSSPTTFFMDCYRGILKILVQASLGLSFVGLVSMLAWVIKNNGEKK
jgi:hypothetical protein